VWIVPSREQFTRSARECYDATSVICCTTAAPISISSTTSKVETSKGTINNLICANQCVVKKLLTHSLTHCRSYNQLGGSICLVDGTTPLAEELHSLSCWPRVRFYCVRRCPLRVVVRPKPLLLRPPLAGKASRRPDATVRNRRYFDRDNGRFGKQCRSWK